MIQLKELIKLSKKMFKLEKDVTNSDEVSEIEII
jgi:hypothetical protein